ncbi:hypothetical protein [Variovorax ginsengisoli]|uniref:Uncharacterized protein n=1 Tax=Variovorax ginsengisoli TaxID=363844 RepID=A0ABT8SGE1_9BURK|nr:hypothetical protein [Variovorax ginsengisoli]MDN8617882.1 hypothetical protein [Variovorax ginsengisoli]MDO1537052.1 hypothetical protein [Variovorax ginsengisoli]
MNTYARVIDGVIAQIIPPVFDDRGREVSLEERFPLDVVAQLVEYDPQRRPDPPPPSLVERVASLLQAVDLHLDAAAIAKGYDGIKSAALRAGYPGPFHDDGVAFATWMDLVYATCYQLLAQFNAGEIAEPTPAELIAMLPTLELPS